MNGIKTNIVTTAIEKIEDGFIFENFCKEYLTIVFLGYDFIPVGGIHDKGIDSLKYTYFRTCLPPATTR